LERFDNDDESDNEDVMLLRARRENLERAFTLKEDTVRVTQSTQIQTLATKSSTV
jgi:hypothetical protein